MRIQRKQNSFVVKIQELKEHKGNFEWINFIKKELLGLEDSTETNIHLDSKRVTPNKVPNCKTPDHDGMYEIWVKKTHPSMTDCFSNWMNASIFEWITKDKTTLTQKDPTPEKWTIPSNYGHITCLSMMWKILTSQTREYIYYLLECCRLILRKDISCLNFWDEAWWFSS